MNPRRSTRGLLVALSVMGAGLIHLAAIRSHLGSPAAVASFTGIGMIQLLLGASLLQPGSFRVKRAAVLGVGVLAVGAWLISRTWGLPAVSGHAEPEAVQPTDLAAVALQLMSLVLILLPVRSPQVHQSRRFTPTLSALPVVAVTALASIALLAVPPHGHTPGSPVRARPAAFVTGGTLVKRAVPLPAAPAPAADGHVDAPSTAPHSH